MPGVTHPVVQPQVLIVEDDPDVRGAMAEALHDEGFEVSMAINAVEALRVLAALESACLVLLDWEIPRVDGRGLLERLRSDERFAGTRVVVMTAEAGPLPPGAVGAAQARETGDAAGGDAAALPGGQRRGEDARVSAGCALT
ncbi:response regulator [Myxococcus sp. MxC21-1]|uniref:response regulator n=1 Tax=Myxococcus sp. MxC21-1 TaxID=3041439 RepID=UPI0029307A3F|nr:response regulator [Myxococcus sp. MxC21-1]WNZ61840.1 response regulator [Myxococcus sp. MxC21-1]